MVICIFLDVYRPFEKSVVLNVSEHKRQSYFNMRFMQEVFL